MRGAFLQQFDDLDGGRRAIAYRALQTLCFPREAVLRLISPRGLYNRVMFLSPTAANVRDRCITAT